MTSYLEEIPTPEEAREYITDVEDFNLAYYTQRLIGEARHDRYDLRTRCAFLVAVGARALWDYEEYPMYYRRPRFLDVAAGAVASHHALEAVAAADKEMPYWQTFGEWNAGIQQSFRSIRPVAGRFRRPEFSSVGCTVLLEHLQNKRAYIRLPAGMTEQHSRSLG